MLFQRPRFDYFFTQGIALLRNKQEAKKEFWVFVVMSKVSLCGLKLEEKEAVIVSNTDGVELLGGEELECCRSRIKLSWLSFALVIAICRHLYLT